MNRNNNQKAWEGKMTEQEKLTKIQKHAESKKTRKQRDREFQAKLDRIRVTKKSINNTNLLDEVERHFEETNFFGNN